MPNEEDTYETHMIWVEGDLNLILERLSHVPERQSRVGPEVERDVLNRVETSKNDIISAMHNLQASREEPEKERLAAQALSAVSMLEADVASLGAHDPDPDTGQNTAGFLQYIKPLIATVSRRLWHLICKFLTLKEWKIGGEVSGGIPALALGKVSLELTFG